jgi:succinate dehydrogenase / fumarate reductase iron-sulfur subunit
MAQEKKMIPVKIRRQDSPQAQAYWQEFLVPHVPNLNVIALLMELRTKPYNAQGEKVSAVAWEAACLEEVCGTCTMLVNGRPRQACTALVDNLTWPIELAPLTKFPIVRDLITNRSRMFEDLKKTKAWVDIDGTYDLGPGPRQSTSLAQDRYTMSTCMTCGCCLEACPQYGPHKKFVGPQVINQVNLFNLHPTGAMQAPERLEALMGEGGITDCGDAQNCVKVCPKNIPLTESIAQVSHDVTKYAFKKLLGGRSVKS